MMTLQERERRAYTTGDLVLADVLGEVMKADEALADAHAEVDDAYETIGELREANCATSNAGVKVGTWL